MAQVARSEAKIHHFPLDRREGGLAPSSRLGVAEGLSWAVAGLMVVISTLGLAVTGCTRTDRGRRRRCGAAIS